MNPYRGEVALMINGQLHVMKLTLGALVELEQALKTQSLAELAARFEHAKPKFSDIALVLAAGLRGAGSKLSEADLLRARIDGGVLAAAQAAGQLLAQAFQLPRQEKP